LVNMTRKMGPNHNIIWVMLWWASQHQDLLWGLVNRTAVHIVYCFQEWWDVHWDPGTVACLWWLWWSVFLLLFSLLNWVGYIVAFTNILTICQIYHTSIQPLHHSPLSLPLHHSWNRFNKYHFSIYIHVCIVFALCSPSYTLSPPPTGTNPLEGPVLPSCSLIL
jgi:hypothetical protein